ncbi:CoA-binding protein [archaeon SCG-AAA382B04]|nr:CoA-binding protein [archaeon SCG-AAA382B04]
MVSNEELKEILLESESIAVVGASSTPWKDAHEVSRYLQEMGYNVVPINPNSEELFDRKAYSSLDEVDVDVDIVDVFRPSREAAAIAKQAIEVNASVLWLQLGIESDEARKIAQKDNLTYIEDTCIMRAHKRLIS